MELRQYFALFRKWVWLMVLLAVIAAGSAYYYSLRITPTYEADTTLLVGSSQSNSSTDPNAIYNAYGISLAQTYALLVTQPPVLQATADATHWPGTWQTLYFHVSTSTPGSQVLKISATGDDPHQVRIIADELAHQLILQSPISAQQKQAEDQLAFVTTQQGILKSEIENGQKTLSDLNTQASLENDPNKLRDLDARITALQARIDTWQKNYTDMAGLLNTGSNLFLSVLAPAREPTTPISPNIRQNVLLAGLGGLALAGVIIFLLEYLDDTIKSSEDVLRTLKLTTLGTIARIADIRQPPDHLITAKHPRSPIAEAYRVLRTNLRFAGIENPSGALLVTSASPAEGKTTTAANLAITMAQAGKRVVLVDSDLRRPSVHKFFDLPNNLGLSNLFLGDATTVDAVLQPTAIPGLRVVTSGPLPPNPAEVLDSKQMTEVLANLRAQSDMVILDSPPALAVADASILGSRCSGVALVIDAGRTRSEVCRRAAETLRQTNVQLLGVVLNKLSSRRSSGYYYYYYYSSKDHQSHGNGHKPEK